ncbi:MAG: hypothetical protein GY810_18330 [Aureispira sp.]|nr:hypothetical protein [Aureispira sp.]
MAKSNAKALKKLSKKSEQWLELASKKGLLKDSQFAAAAKKVTTTLKLAQKALVESGVAKKASDGDKSVIEDLYNKVAGLFKGNILGGSPDGKNILDQIEGFLNQADEFLIKAGKFAIFKGLKAKIKDVQGWVAKGRSLLEDARKVQQIIVKKMGQIEILKKEFDKAAKGSKEQLDIAKKLIADSKAIFDNAVANSKKSDDAIGKVKIYIGAAKDVLSKVIEGVDVVVGTDGNMPEWYKNIEKLWNGSIKDVLNIPYTDWDDKLIAKVDDFKTKTLEPFLKEAQKYAEKFKEYIKMAQAWLGVVSGMLSDVQRIVNGFKNKDAKDVVKGAWDLIDKFKTQDWLPGTDWDEKMVKKLLEMKKEAELKAAGFLAGLITKEGTEDFDKLKNGLLGVYKSAGEYLDVWKEKFPDQSKLFVGEDKIMVIDKTGSGISEDDATKLFGETVPDRLKSSPLEGQIQGVLDAIEKDLLATKINVDHKFTKHMQAGSESSQAFVEANKWFSQLKKLQEKFWAMITKIRGLVFDILTLGVKALADLVGGGLVEKATKIVGTVTDLISKGENIPVVGDLIKQVKEKITYAFSFPVYTDKGMQITAEIQKVFTVAMKAKYNDVLEALAKVAQALMKVSGATKKTDGMTQEQYDEKLKKAQAAIGTVKADWDKIKKEIQSKYTKKKAPVVYREQALRTAKRAYVAAWFATSMQTKGKKAVNQMDNTVVAQLKTPHVQFFKRAGVDWPNQGTGDRIVMTVACWDHKGYGKKMEKLIAFAKKDLKTYQNVGTWKAFIQV